MKISKSDIVLFLVLVNVLVAVTGSLTGENGLHSGLVRGALMLLLIPPMMLSGVRLNWAGIVMIACLAYLLLLVPFSSNPVSSSDTLLKVALSLAMFLVGYNFLRSERAHSRLALLVLVSLVLLILNFVAAQLFGLGQSYYHEEGFNVTGGVQQTYMIVYFLLFIPLLGFFRGGDFQLRWYDFLIFLVALFPLFLIGRRGAIVAFLLGFLVYLVITPRKGRVLSIVTMAILGAAISMPLYADRMEGVIENRMQAVNDPEQIGRVQELIQSWDTLRQESADQALFGTELFNSRALTGGTRALHTDYATYLIGAGVIGFLLYFGIIAAVCVDFLRRSMLIQDPFKRREFTAVLMALVAAYFVISFTGQYYVVSSLAVIFCLLGAILAYIESCADAEDEKGSAEFQT